MFCCEWVKDRMKDFHLSQANCCRGTKQEYRSQVSVIGVNGGSLVRSFKRCPEQNCFEVVQLCVQRQDSPDARGQRVPGPRRCHWKGSVADRGPAGWRHSRPKCRRAGRSKTATSINFSGQVKWLGDVRWCLVIVIVIVPTCVTMPNLVALGQTIWAYAGDLKQFWHVWPRPLRWGAGSTHRNTPLPTCHRAQFGRSIGQTVWALVRRSTGKIGLSHPALQGHSRSLKTTRIDRLSMTSY